MDSGTRKNFASYYLNFVVMAAVGFIVNPLLLTALGPLIFGVWKSLQRYLDFATVADGRASQALKWIVASRSAHSDLDRQRDVGAAIRVWLHWLPAAALVAAAVTVTLPILIRGIPDDYRSLVFITAGILSANTILAGLLAIPDSVLVGVNKGYKSMLVTTAAFVVTNAAMVVAAFSVWPLWSLAVIVLLAAVANGAVTLFIARRNVSWWGASRPTVSDLRRVHGYSAWTLGWVIVDKLFLASELIVVSVMVGAVGVTQYTFTSYVMQFVLSIALVTASGFMPVLGAQFGASNLTDAADRTRSVRHLVVGVAVLGTGAVLAFNGEFVTMWAGADQYLGVTINTLLALGGLQLALIRMDGQILDVTMRIAPKVLVGLLSSTGGIVAGFVSFVATDSLAIALFSVILLRLVSNATFPTFVKRSIPGSGLPWPSLILGAAVLLASLAVEPLLQAAGSVIAKALIATAWVVFAAAAVWAGLLPRSTVRALARRM